VKPLLVDDLATADLSGALAGIDTVIHLAARAHVMRDASLDPLSEFRKVNVAATRNLACQAAAAGVKRMIFMSSIKVHGECGRFSESDAPAPQDAYGVSKHEAETTLREIAGQSRLEFVIVRPPLVYGPGVKANFQALIGAVARGLPLPLGAINNCRSLVSRDNLVDFVLRCTSHPAAANEAFLVSDGEDLSTPELVRRLARAMGRPARLVPIPPAILRGGAAMLGRRAMAQRLLGSLQLDISKARRVLEWSPPFSVDEGLRRATAPN
jgi:nucleoside-diphosphate-sugar epimerase